MKQALPESAIVPQTLPPFFEKIYAKSSLQKKMIKGFLETRDPAYWRRLESFSTEFLKFIESRKVSLDYVVDAYLKMCLDMLREQIQFKKTGEYSSKTAAEANERVYSSQPEMTSYMYGLALSQFLWPNHYGQFDFFLKETAKLSGINSYLEIGPGHGLFLVEALRSFPTAQATAVDISPISIKISENMVNFFAPGNNCRFVLSDVNRLDSGAYDYVVMCELLEHLDNPSGILEKVRSLLPAGGHCFITTCANAPAIDHVYLYNNVEHIRRELREAGFTILSELALPVGNFTEDRWDAEKVEVNYAAMLQKA